MQIHLYLKRIKYTGSLEPSLETLSQLQQTHLMHVPFENMDIHNNIRIDLSNLFDKVITRRRGGFCYELNGLFYELLKEIGFTVKMVSARVYDGKEKYSQEFDHMALVVEISNNKYLVDVGFGEFALYPIKIELDTETNDPKGIFRIEAFDENYIVVKKKGAEGNYIPEYIFTEKERQLSEFYEMCNYHQTNSASHFMQKKICSLPTKNGRITLTGDTLKITANGEITERKLNDKLEVNEVLSNYFGIEM